MKKIPFVAGLLALSSVVHALPQDFTGPGNFTMLDGTGATVGNFNDVTGFVDYSAGTFGVASTSTFFGLNWTASGGTMFGPGSYTISTTDPAPGESGGDYTVTIGANQMGGHIDFAWGATAGIDVLLVWDITDNGDGTWTFTSVDSDADADAFSGTGMIDGPFPNFSANFSFTAPEGPDTRPPEIALIGASTVNLPLNDPYVEQGATCTDPTYAGDVDLSASITTTGTVDSTTEGTYTITYACNDGANPEVTITRTVNVIGVAPYITLLGDNPTVHEAGAPYTDAGATCQDDYDNTFAAGDGSIPLPTSGPGSLFFGATSDVNANVAGAYTVSYNCTDSESNNAVPAVRNVTVQDTTAPTISLSAACPIAVMGGAAFADPTPTATATDIVDGDVTASLALPTAIASPTFTTGELSRSFTQTYSVSDVAGNTATASCQITVGNPTPVVTLNGAANVTVNESDGYTDPGAVCQDFNVATPGTPDTLTATADRTIDTSTPAGSYTITYSCTDADNFTGTVTRSVVVASATGGGYTAAPATSGSNFSMLDPTGAYVGGAADIYSNWDGTLLTSTAQATINMSMGSALPTPFFGDPWTAYNIRVFGPGSYTIDTVQGPPLSFTVGPNQIGAHMLFEWSTTSDIDVAIVWDINGAFGGAGPASGQVFNLVSVDGDGDGFPGIRMVDGPFVGFSANFNINFTPAYALAAAQAPLLTASQGSNTTRTVVTGGGPVIVTASTTGTFDWSTSSGALLTVEDTADGDDAVFTFDPSGLAPGTYTVAVTVDGVPGSLLISVVSSAGGLDVADVDNDGIPNYLDDTATPTIMQLTPGGGSIVAGSGMLELGDIAFVSGADGAAVSAAEITAAGGVADSTSSESCIGGCFDFAVTGVTPGGSVQVVLPLSASIPANAVYRKLIGGAWRDFSATGGNAIASAMAVNGVCPAVASGDYTDGLTAGNDCVRLTLVDGGPNDADSTPNGIVRDPGGVAVAAAVQAPVSTIGDPSLGGGGCTLAARPASAAKAGDWLLVGLALAGLAFLRRRAA